MKNKLLKLILLSIFICNISLAEQYRFETSEIEIIDEGNLINAKNGKVVSTDGNLEINAEKFEFIKDLNILNAFNGVAFLNLTTYK